MNAMSAHEYKMFWGRAICWVLAVYCVVNGLWWLPVIVFSANWMYQKWSLGAADRERRKELKAEARRRRAAERVRSDMAKGPTIWDSIFTRGLGVTLLMMTIILSGYIYEAVK